MFREDREESCRVQAELLFGLQTQRKKISSVLVLLAHVEPLAAVTSPSEPRPNGSFKLLLYDALFICHPIDALHQLSITMETQFTPFCTDMCAPTFPRTQVLRSAESLWSSNKGSGGARLQEPDWVEPELLPCWWRKVRRQASSSPPAGSMSGMKGCADASGVRGQVPGFRSPHSSMLLRSWLALLRSDAAAPSSVRSAPPQPTDWSGAPPTARRRAPQLPRSCPGKGPVKSR